MSVASFAGLLQGGMGGRGGSDQPSVEVQAGKKACEIVKAGKVRIFVQENMRGGKEAGEPGGADSFEGQFERGGIARLATDGGRGVETNGEKQSRRGLKFVNAAAERIAARFEKNEASAWRKGADKMRDARMLQRFATADPENGRGTIENAANLFVRNGMSRSGVQDFRSVDELDQGCAMGCREERGETNFREFCGEQRRESACGLKPAAQPKFAGLELEGGKIFDAAREIGVTRESVDGKGIAVEMIFQVEDAGKTGAGEIGFGPGAVGLLLVDEVGDGFGDGGIVDAGAGEKSDQAPGGLRSGARALALGERARRSCGGIRRSCRRVSERCGARRRRAGNIRAC